MGLGILKDIFLPRMRHFWHFKIVNTILACGLDYLRQQFNQEEQPVARVLGAVKDEGVLCLEGHHGLPYRVHREPEVVQLAVDHLRVRGEAPGGLIEAAYAFGYGVMPELIARSEGQELDKDDDGENEIRQDDVDDNGDGQAAHAPQKAGLLDGRSAVAILIIGIPPPRIAMVIGRRR